MNMLTQLLQQLTDPTVAVVIGGAIVAWAVQWAKKRFGWKPSTDDLPKRLTAIVSSILVAAAGAWIASAAGKAIDLGAVAFNVLAAATGGTVLHQLFLRSPQSKTPGAV